MSGKPCCRRLALLLALTACAMQVLGLSLPSRVICYRPDRPPQVEFFSDSCSCRHEEAHSCSDLHEHGAPCIEAACIDVHLSSPAVPARWQRHLGDGQGSVLAADHSVCVPAFLNLPPAPASLGIPWGEAPPPPAAISQGSRLRC